MKKSIMNSMKKQLKIQEEMARAVGEYRSRMEREGAWN